MKLKIFTFIMLFMFSTSISLFADSKTESEQDKKWFTGSIVIGAATIDGINYQQFAFRPEFKFWKIGIGLDVQILLDENGNIRIQDWNNFDAYLDKLIYISWGTKGKDIFYGKFGGLDYSYIGYKIIVDGYSNMIEYPTYKRQGLEFAVSTKKFQAELLINDIKELWHGTPSVIIGGRAAYNIVAGLSLGLSVGTDLNEYSGLRDSDNDGYPDEIDVYPYNKDYVTKIDEYKAKGISDTTINQLVSAGLLDSTRIENLTPYSNQISRSVTGGVDLGYQFIKNDFMDLNVYSQFAYMFNTNGFGFSAPGVKFRIAFVTLVAEYRQTSDKFVFGYYNNTYELERATFVDDGSGHLVAQTKSQTLESVKGMKGFLAGLSFNILNFVSFGAQYQELYGKETISRSLRAEISANASKIPILSEAKFYYIRNNFEDFKHWATPGTVMGGVIGLEIVKGAVIDFNYLWTFEDKNGDGIISGDNEIIKNISVSAKTVF